MTKQRHTEDNGCHRALSTMSSSSHSNTVGHKYPGRGVDAQGKGPFPLLAQDAVPHLPSWSQHNPTRKVEGKGPDPQEHGCVGTHSGEIPLKGLGHHQLVHCQPGMPLKAWRLVFTGVPMEAHLVAIWLTSVSIPLEDKLIPRPKAPAQVTCCYGPKPHLNLFAGVVQSPRGK